MTEFVQPLEHNSKLEQGLFPGVAVHFLMPANNTKPTPDEARLLTRWHEASHAVLATVLAQASCAAVSISDPMKPGAVTPIDRSGDKARWSLTADLIDLAGLYGELVAIEMVHGTRMAFQHIKNAFFDLESARRRIALSREGEGEWAAARGGLALMIVRYFEAAIRAVADALQDAKTLPGEKVGELVEANLPHGVPEPAVRDVLKPSFAALCGAAAGARAP